MAAKTESAEPTGANGAKSSRDLIWECFQQVTALGLSWLDDKHLMCWCQSYAFSILCTKVTAETNLGAWLNDEYGDRKKMAAVLDRVVTSRFSILQNMPDILSIEPLATLNECFVGIQQLDYGPNAKHGCC